MSTNLSRLKEIAVAFDQFCNAVLGGYACETFSARCYRCQDRNKFWPVARAVVDTIFFFQPEHCKQAYEYAKTVKSHLPQEYR